MFAESHKSGACRVIGFKLGSLEISHYCHPSTRHCWSSIRANGEIYRDRILVSKTCVIFVSLLLLVANKSHIVPIHLHRIVRKTDNMYSAVLDNRRGGVSNNSVRRELHGHLACGDKRTVEAV